MNLFQIKARCIDDGGCWLWTGANNGGDHPKINMVVDGRRTQVSARRVVYQLAHGELPARYLVSVSCGDGRCLNPAHLVAKTRSAVSKRAAALLGPKLRRAASVAISQRARAGKITMESAREIRVSEKSGVLWARELGCSPTLIWNVRHNKSWKEYDSPFAGLLLQTRTKGTA